MARQRQMNNKTNNKTKDTMIVIYFDDEHSKEDTIREVLRLLNEGYTSGINPDWAIK
jgi:hypothetical protein